ncbi:MAG TPA: tail fiber domain-containing protein [Candidatus Paceibacterota bacterium]|nr:tail fiber domain-containing protein [Candidatus Paceibacterota bacterium]
MEQDFEKNKIPSAEAAKLFGVTGDYVTLLCRRGKVEGELRGRTWYVSAWSLEKYLREMKNIKEARKTQLSEDLKREYQSVAPERKPKKKKQANNFSPFFRYNALAPLAVLIIFVGAWALSFAQSLPLSVLADAYRQPASYKSIEVVPLMAAAPLPRDNAAAVLAAARADMSQTLTLENFASGANLVAAVPLALSRNIQDRVALDTQAASVGYGLITNAVNVALAAQTEIEFSFTRNFVDWADDMSDAQAGIYAALGDAVTTDLQSSARAVAFWNDGARPLARSIASVPLAFMRDMTSAMVQETAGTYYALQSAGNAMADTQAALYYNIGNAFVAWADAMGDAQAHMYQTLADGVTTQVNAGAAALGFWLEGSLSVAQNASDAAAASLAYVSDVPSHMSLPRIAIAQGNTASVWNAVGDWWNSIFAPAQPDLAIAPQGNPTTTVVVPVQSAPGADMAALSQGEDAHSPAIKNAQPVQSAPAAIVPAPSTQFLASNYVTQSSLADQLSQLNNNLRSLIYQNAGSVQPQGSTIDYGQYSTGGYTNNVALSQIVSNLSGVTITNATITNSTFNGSSTGGASALSALTDVDASSPAWGDLLQYDGSKWVNVSTSSLGIIGGGGSVNLYASTTIGDGAPAGGLTISGGATTTGNAYFGGNIDIGGYDPLETLFAQKSVNNSRGVRYTLSNTNTSGQSYAGAILYADNQAVASQFYADGLGTGPLGTPGFYIGNFSNHPIGFFTNNTEKARLTADGSFGIGTTSPWAQLSVNPNGISGPAFVIGSSTKTLFTIDTLGNVGIGRLPSASISSFFSANGTLQLSGTSALYLSNSNSVLTAASGQAGVNVFNNFNNSTGLIVRKNGTGSGDYLSVEDNSINPQFVIKSSGNVGVGTSSPYAKLTVWGGSSTAGNALEVANSASTSILTVSNSGVFSVGANGSNAFTVDSSSGTTTISNLSIGNLSFDTDAGVVALSNIPVDSGAAAGVIQSQSINIGDTSVLTVYGESNGTGGVQNLRVGIGTTSPAASLSILGTAGYNPFTIASTSGSSLFSIDQTGSATVANGINITSGCYAINGTCLAAGGGSLNLYASTTIGDGTQQGGLTISGGATTTGTAYFGSNVGIGTTSPIASLSISGSSGNASVGPGLLNMTLTNDTTYVWGGVVLAPNLTTGHILLTQLTGVNAALNNSGYMGFKYSSSGSSSNALTWGFYSNDQLVNLLATGNLGIGTTSPYARLSVAGDIVGATINATSTTATSTISGGLNVGNGNLVYNLNSGITSINNLAIGSLNFDTDAGIVSWADLPVDSSASAGTVESYTANVGGSPVLTIYGTADGTGNINNLGVGIGTQAPAYLLDVATSTTGAIVARFTNGTGSCTINPTSGSVGCSSDERLKTNITSINASSSLALVMALDPVFYNWLTEATGTPEHSGFIAQDVQKVFPDLVATDTASGYLTLNYAGFTPYLAAAIQQIANLGDNFKATLIAWLGDAQNGIHDLYATIFHAKEVDTDKLCVGSVCVTQAQFLAMVNASGQGSAGTPSPAPTPSDDATSTPTASSDDATSTPPTSSDDTASSTPLTVETPPAPDTDASSTPPVSDPAPSDSSDASSTPQN